jgi:hypothetical protein
MAKSKKARSRPAKNGPARGKVAAIPLAEMTVAATRLARGLDQQVSTGNYKARKFASLKSGLIIATVRDFKVRGGSQSLDFGKVSAIRRWPDTLYVPRSDGNFLIPRPPTDHLYSDDWTGGTGVETADKNTGALFVIAGAKTTDSGQYSDAGVGIRYTPRNSLSYIRYEPEVNCAVTYRMFVDFWPMLIAGNLRARASLFVGAWLLNPVLNGSFELVHAREVPVFDTLSQDAGSNVWPNVPYSFPKNFPGSALATTFLVQGGRTYLLGVVARAQVEHNVTTNAGKQIPHDGSRFKLYSQLICSVPFMSVLPQQVLIP